MESSRLAAIDVPSRTMPVLWAQGSDGSVFLYAAFAKLTGHPVGHDRPTGRAMVPIRGRLA